MNLDCATDRYDTLYAPWLPRAETLLRLADYKPRKHVLLDLCGGTGIVARMALSQKGADPKRIFLYDLNPRCPDTRIRQFRGRAEDMELPWGMFDVVVCRQAMGYLEPAAVIRRVARILKPGGVFVFNSFDKPARFGAKQYRFNGHRYAEAHLSLFGHVWHVQARLDLGETGGVDVTRFQYHDEAYLWTLLDRSFKVRIVREGRSVRWLCTRRTP